MAVFGLRARDRFSIGENHISGRSPSAGCENPSVGLKSSDMDTPIYEYVMTRLEGSKGKWPEVAEGSGVSRRTLEKIARSEIQDPGVSHIEKLYRYFRDQEAA